MPATPGQQEPKVTNMSTSTLPASTPANLLLETTTGASRAHRSRRTERCGPVLHAHLDLPGVSQAPQGTLGDDIGDLCVWSPAGDRHSRWRSGRPETRGAVSDTADRRGRRRVRRAARSRPGSQVRYATQWGADRGLLSGTGLRARGDRAVVRAQQATPAQRALRQSGPAAARCARGRCRSGPPPGPVRSECDSIIEVSGDRSEPHGEIVRRACAGDDQALSQLVALYHDSVYRYGRSVCRDVDLDDAVQDARTARCRRRRRAPQAVRSSGPTGSTAGRQRRESGGNPGADLRR